MYLNKTISTLFSKEEKKTVENFPHYENQLKTLGDVEAALKYLDTTLETYVQKQKQSRAHLYLLYMFQMSRFRSHLKKQLSKNLSWEKNSKNSWHVQIQEEKSSPWQRLTTPYFEVKKIKFNSRHWLRENFLSLIKDLIPTALGGLGSLFVYFGGGSELAKACHTDVVDRILDQPAVRVICLGIVLGITLYLAYTYVHTNRKFYERDKLLQKTKTDITNKEKDLIEEVTRYNILKKIGNGVRQLCSVFHILDSIP